MLYQLLLFKSQRGDFNISANDPAYNLLYNWVQNQRKHYKLYQEASSSIVGNGAAAAAAGGAGGTGASAGGNASTATAMATTVLNADRIAVLDTIEFPWNIRGDSFWQKHYDALCGYKREHGDVKVPRLYNKNLKLGEWVSDQRRQWKFKCDGKPSMMTDERKQKLDELGFVWKVRDRADWNDRYEQLLEFKKEVSLQTFEMLNEVRFDD